MAPPPKRLTPAQIRDRRAKIAAAVLGVVFLIVVAIQGPKLMAELSPKKPADETVAPAPATPAAPVGSSGTAAVAAVVGETKGQLARFSTFPAKDPFKQLVSDGTGAAAGPTGAAGAAKGPTKPATTFTETTAGGAPGGGGSGATVPAALILYNGHKQVVALGDGFPAKQPVFRLVSLGLTSVRIGLVGGSFANGKTTLALPRNRKVTLGDSTTGESFVLRLVKLTTAPAPAKAATGAGATTTTTAPVTTTPVTTTPVTTTPTATG